MAVAPRSDHTHVLLVRGINVGGHAKVPMAHLRRIATAADALEASTILNSGNVLFRVDRQAGPQADADAWDIAYRVQSALESELGLTVTVIPASRAELATALALHGRLGFAGGEDRLTHLALLAEPAGPEQAEALETLDAGEDRCAVSGRFVWLRYANASHSSKLSLDRIERTLGTRATARNLLTVRRLAAVA
ncbi:MAG: DUF1697 domain-containing protein [Micrococcus sp.]|nr:DUF1697 domain-containing protein [Micrococcus sp.]